MKIINAVYDFNEQIIQMPNDLPMQSLTPELKKWFERAVSEEMEEFHQAWSDDDVVKQVDAILDLIYFAVGRLQQMGLSRNQVLACFWAVHTANMTKKRGAQAKRDNVEADAIKPESWVSPEEKIAKILDLTGGV